MIMTLQSKWKKQEVGGNREGEFPLALPRGGRAHRCVVSLCQTRGGFQDKQYLPLCVHDPEHQAPSPGAVPMSPEQTRGSPGQGSSAQEGNPSLTAAEPPLQCPGREGLSLEGSQLAEQSGHPRAVPLHAQLDNSKPRALSLPESHICPLKQSVST